MVSIKEIEERIKGLPRHEAIEALKELWRGYTPTQKLELIGMLATAPISPPLSILIGTTFLGEEALKGIEREKELKKLRERVL